MVLLAILVLSSCSKKESINDKSKKVLSESNTKDNNTKHPKEQSVAEKTNEDVKSASDDIVLNYEDVNYNKNESDPKLYNLYSYIKKNLKLKDYKLIESAGEEDSKFVVAVDPKITFNNKVTRVDSKNNTTTLYLTYEMNNKKNFNSSVEIDLYYIGENVEAYTYDQVFFAPNTPHESSTNTLIKFRDFTIRITHKYDNKNYKVDSEEYFIKSQNISTENTKQIINLLKMYK